MPLGWTELDSPKRTWREWTLTERLLVCLGPPLILGYWLDRDYRRGGLVEVTTGLGTAVVIGAAYVVIRRLRAR